MRKGRFHKGPRIRSKPLKRIEDYEAWGVTPKAMAMEIIRRDRPQNIHGLQNVCQFCEDTQCRGKGGNLVKIVEDYYVHERCIHEYPSRAYPAIGF